MGLLDRYVAGGGLLWTLAALFVVAAVANATGGTSSRFKEDCFLEAVSTITENPKRVKRIGQEAAALDDLEAMCDAMEGRL